jgi:hypothetical protein
MQVGSLDTFKATRIEVNVGKYFSTVGNPNAGQDYALAPK